MNLRAAIALSLFSAACAEAPVAEGTLIANQGSTSSQVQGLRRAGDGPFIKGSDETLTAAYDAAHVRKLEWSASAGALFARNAQVKWTLPQTDFAELTLTLTLDDGTQVVTPFGFSLVEPRENSHAVKSASEALLAAPMPVLDGGVVEISGGACELEYDTTGANLSLAFTSATHPAIYFGKWNGSAWALEVMDTLGFNTGGRIGVSQVHLKVDASGNPHIVYVRDSQVWYATKSGTTWTRERVDAVTTPAYDAENRALAIGLNSSGRPSVLYGTNSTERVVFATRTATNTWTQTTLSFPVGTVYASLGRGDLLFDGAGVAYFPVFVNGSATNGYIAALASWNGTAVELRQMTLSGVPGPGWDLAVVSAAWAGSTGRMVLRTAGGVYDVTLASPLANSTWTWSAVEQTGAGVGDLAWNGRPVVLHHHNGGSMELVTPATTGASFWTWTQMGTSTGVSASVAVHPSTGVPSICYQSSGRVMFQ